MGNVRLYGSTSGYTELAPPAVAPDGVLSLPSGTGTLLTAEGGKILQVVRATDATNRTTTSTSFVDVTGMSVTITPTKNTSAIIIVASFVPQMTTAQDLYLRITDSANNTISGAENIYYVLNSALTRVFPVTLWAYATPATTSATTYKLQFRVSGSTATIYNAQATGQLFAIEVSA
jgi:hypothetical protein